MGRSAKSSSDSRRNRVTTRAVRMFRLIVGNVELMIAYDNATTDSPAEEINAVWHSHGLVATVVAQS
ncbi:MULTISPECIES: hypothetical protein [Rhodococcus]|uniref:Transposase n=1 Tax=Rhodococcus globerulus TaxID=33008 RepID=A0ABU4BXK5_RHOGO|nr:MULTISPECIES: hypothetical protein [Rhodococcus]MDV6268966.1 hypothetical protein [Rhodococcus globerulus]MDV8067450.1 hypothetical protein [Rhodococcus sp. IEGM 1366]